MKTSFLEFIKEQKSDGILNFSFNITINDVDQLIDDLRYEYKNVSPNELNNYLNERKEIAINILKTDFSFDEDGILIGIENFPNTITLYRIIDNYFDKIDKNKLGRF